ncbi:LOW QUALITY PROTEIN: hypothetical protein BT93_L3922 [Corymbia citriodora subsp. variegata]|uniref:F-box domain-containing protein n=1 Tax=Corymbia citriodora subsp. variegata TaxID=360336 RepID=A0A8T0CKJ9_CORYI|nr:LOW QUALITY PROTEIN: hypothetical protein BT93_L3922 [Corymbia citriodora subsp. variegata]
MEIKVQIWHLLVDKSYGREHKPSPSQSLHRGREEVHQIRVHVNKREPSSSMLLPMSSCNPPPPSSSSSSSRCETPTMSSLPLDLLRNVLSRLSTISLLELRSVCREWRDIIDDAHFCRHARHHAIESPRILLLSKPSHSGEPQIEVDDEFLVTSLPEFMSWVDGAGASCYGLLCFEDFRNRATYVLNPLTREIVPLPSVDRLHERWCPFSIEIGASRLTSRYKIVRLSYLNDGAVCAHRAEVLDQGSRSWRDIASVPSSLLLGDPVFAAGSIHWSDLGGHVVGISSFDITKEEFTPTPCPELRDPHLVELQGVLGLVDSLREEGVDVWVMEEESGRWTKEYSVQPIPPSPAMSHRVFDVLGCGGRKIALSYLESSWIFYDPATDEQKYVKRPDAFPDTIGGSFTVSLLSPAKLWNSGEVKEISPE